jgi:pimeloyl-ACP methyl ester carboxylesterase
MQGPHRCLRPALGVCAALTALAIGVPPAFAARTAGVPALIWQPCGTAAAVQCASARVPLDYDRPGGRKVTLFVARSPATEPAQRIGSLFVNFGGPGGTAADTVEAGGAGVFRVLNRRFDIVAMDPRGVGQSQPSIDCKVNQETLGLYSQPFTTPLNLRVRGLVSAGARYIKRCLARSPTSILKHVSTANVARDLNLLRRALGERRLNYLGFSYGSLLGATFARLFPRSYRTMVLDGPLDPSVYLNSPLEDGANVAAALERALGRFFRACAVDQVACRGFGGNDPRKVYDRLARRLDAAPLPAAGYPSDPRPVDGDDLRAATAIALYKKQFWPLLAQALAGAKAGDGSSVRQLADLFYMRVSDGSYDPFTDRFFTIRAAEVRFPRSFDTYLRAGERSWRKQKHFWFNTGYSELQYGLYPLRDRDAFYGPFRVPRSSPTPLVVATTHDPSTPYGDGKNLVRELGNARLLTMRGDGHTAYGSGSPTCIDPAIERYLITVALPAAGATCRQDVPFSRPQARAPARSRRSPVPRVPDPLQGLGPLIQQIRR